MWFNRAVRGVASACLVVVMSACGGGGGDDPRTSTVTLPSSTPATAAGTYTTQDQKKYVEDTGTSLGNSTTIDFKFGNGLYAGVSYINSNPAIYIIGISDSSGDYMCGSALANAAIGITTCPSTVQFNLNAKTVIFNNAVLQEYDGLQADITASGNLQWN